MVAELVSGIRTSRKREFLRIPSWALLWNRIQLIASCPALAATRAIDKDLVLFGHLNRLGNLVRSRLPRMLDQSPRIFGTCRSGDGGKMEWIALFITNLFCWTPVGCPAKSGWTGLMWMHAGERGHARAFGRLGPQGRPFWNDQDPDALQGRPKFP